MVLDNILYARAYTSEHQFEMLDYVAAKFHEEAGVFKLLVSLALVNALIKMFDNLNIILCRKDINSKLLYPVA